MNRTTRHTVSPPRVTVRGSVTTGRPAPPRIDLREVRRLAERYHEALKRLADL